MASISKSCTTAEALIPNNELRDATGSAYPHIALIFIQIVAFNIPNFKGRRTVFACSIISLAVAAQTNRFTNDIGLANFFALAWPHYLSTLEKIVFSGPQGPEGDLWRLDKPAQEALSFTAFSFAKLKWALLLLLNLRGVDWSFQIANIPKRGSRYSSRFSFLLAQTIELVGTILMADLIAQATVRIVFTASDGTVGNLNSKCLTLRDKNLAWSFLKALVYGSGPYYFINMQYILCSIIAVAVGLSSPKDWPPLFGKLAEVTTVRKFWGSFWQQMMRRFFTTYSQAFVKRLGISRGTNLSSYTQLFLTFFVSGIFHASSILLMPSPTNITFAERTAGIMLYFVWQAVAITFEDFVQWLWKTVFGDLSKARGWSHIIGYIWVTCSFWFSLPWAGDVMMRIKMGEVSPFPFAISAPLVELIPIR